MNDQKTEILAPVGSREMLQAAVHNGADSVYIGVPEYNARGRSKNFNHFELKDLIEEAHLFGLKVYLALNVLVFEDEVGSVYEEVLRLSSLLPDAFIIQDAGLARILKTSGLDVRLHASTQMTVAGEMDIEFYSDLNFQRFTLSRELSFNEINKIRSKTNTELEVFIHGSLCISYSGQCLTSSGFGGRSANRGECAQSCRHPYELYVDGKILKTDGPFLVSPQDLNGTGYEERLKEIGINALKIEGRLKTPHYVAAALRTHAGGFPEYESRLTYERGFSQGWLSGFDSKELVDESFNSHTGIEIGKILNVEGRDILVENRSAMKLSKGDGIFIPSGDKGYGFRIRNISEERNAFRIFPGKDFSYDKVRKGMRVFLSGSHKTEKDLQKSFTSNDEKKKIPLHFRFSAHEGGPISLEVSDDLHNTVILLNQAAVEKARKHPTRLEDVEKELSALSGTCYILSSLEADMDEDLFIPNQHLKSLRNDAAGEMDILRKAPRQKRNSALLFAEVNERLKTEYNNTTNIKDAGGDKQIFLNILIREPDDAMILTSLPEKSVDLVYLEFEYGRFYNDAVEKLRESGYRVGIALNRVMKTGEEKEIDKLISIHPDAFLLRNAGSLNYFLRRSLENEFELIGDFSLNITNHFSADYFLNRGLSRISSSYDLFDDSLKNTASSRQESFINKIPADRFEFIMSYYLPSFYMEYCLYAHHLGSGGNFRTCRFPCKNHIIYLKDRMGETHPVLTDQNCRNTMYNGRKRNLSGKFSEFQNMGVRNFRLEFLGDGKDLSSSILNFRSLAENIAMDS